ncbi:hypothetical protein DV515_00003299 [Chloebia gouldiae]|uniref:Uncharacterized protein n=1 Tax=Chloebia gouldiae TaxID=44316 RepID=A0A3L8STZ4_CHLGU|nr:hypothetical protein DV515_00003299 [Chloebia gouldiae]
MQGHVLTGLRGMASDKDIGFRLNIRKKFLTVRVVRQWKSFTREVVDDSCLEVSKANSGVALSNLV